MDTQSVVTSVVAISIAQSILPGSQQGPVRIRRPVPLTISTIL
jgi:hypothetical protein